MKKLTLQKAVKETEAMVQYFSCLGPRNTIVDRHVESKEHHKEGRNKHPIVI